VLRRRFGLEGDPPEKLEAIGQRLGLTRERIRQIEAAGSASSARSWGARDRRVRSSERDGGFTMKHGFLVMDSDLHTMEPDGLWSSIRGAVPEIRAVVRAPDRERVESAVIRIGTLEIGEMSRRPQSALVGRTSSGAPSPTPALRGRHAGLRLQSHVAAMDIEGIDVAVIYGTRGAKCRCTRPRPEVPPRSPEPTTTDGASSAPITPSG